MAAPPSPTPAAAPTALRMIALGRQQLRVAVRPGDGSRTPLLLCNGIGASVEMLQPLVDALDPALEVIRFDVPGIGGSPLPAHPYRFSWLTALLSRLLTELGHAEVDVLGLSWGGGLAQQLAVQHARRVRRLVLVATATGVVMVPASPRVLVHMVTPRRHRDRVYAARIAPTIYGGTARQRPAAASAALHRDSSPTSRRAYLYQLGAGAWWTSLPFLPLIRQPTLVLAGDDDPLIPLANARVLHALIPRARLHVYRGGHLALVTEAAELAPVVDRFLTAGSVAQLPGGWPAQS